MTQNSKHTYTVTPGTVYIVGAGPGAPDLIAVRGRDIIEQADLILYADSLVEYSVADLASKPDAKIVASSGLHLGEILDLMVETAKAGGVVARVHSGDPALYGATHEQMAHLEDHNIPYEIVPGITAAFAAAAILHSELTVPDVVQTIILTRTAGRTTMPAGEDLQALAAPGASLAIYLSVTRIQKVIDDLLASGGYTPETPVAVLHKVTWPDESYVVGTLADIADKVRAAKYTKHALILVSPALDPRLKGEDRRTSSHLYDPTYTHRFRKAADYKSAKDRRAKERQEASDAATNGNGAAVIAGEKHLGSTQRQRQGTVAIGITKRGSELAEQLAQTRNGSAAVPQKFAPNNSGYDDSVINEVRRQWTGAAELILVMPTGVAMRAIAPLLGDKASDPAVVCVDESGQWIVPLLGGHQAGANALAQALAEQTGGQAVITTASDVQGKPALDLLGKEAGWRIDPASALTHASASLVNDETLGLVVDLGEKGSSPEVQSLLDSADNIERIADLDELDLDTYVAGLVVSDRAISDHHLHLMQKSVLYRPPTLVVGMGCKRGVPLTELQTALESTLREQGYALESVAALATVDLKADEVGLQQLATALKIPLRVVTSEQLRELEPAGFSPSAATEKLDLPGVAEPCALIESAGGELVVRKQSHAQCTVAVARVA